MTIDEIIAILATPIDFKPLHEKVDSIKGELNAIGAELDALDTELKEIEASCAKLRARLFD